MAWPVGVEADVGRGRSLMGGCPQPQACRIALHGPLPLQLYRRRGRTSPTHAAGLPAGARRLPEGDGQAPAAAAVWVRAGDLQGAPTGSQAVSGWQRHRELPPPWLAGTQAADAWGAPAVIHPQRSSATQSSSRGGIPRGAWGYRGNPKQRLWWHPMRGWWWGWGGLTCSSSVFWRHQWQVTPYLES